MLAWWQIQGTFRTPPSCSPPLDYPLAVFAAATLYAAAETKVRSVCSLFLRADCTLKPSSARLSLLTSVLEPQSGHIDIPYLPAFTICHLPVVRHRTAATPNVAYSVDEFEAQHQLTSAASGFNRQSTVLYSHAVSLTELYFDFHHQGLIKAKDSFYPPPKHSRPLSSSVIQPSAGPTELTPDIQVTHSRSTGCSVLPAWQQC